MVISLRKRTVDIAFSLLYAKLVLRPAAYSEEQRSMRVVEVFYAYRIYTGKFKKITLLSFLPRGCRIRGQTRCLSPLP